MVVAKTQTVRRSWEVMVTAGTTMQLMEPGSSHLLHNLVKPMARAG